MQTFVAMGLVAAFCLAWIGLCAVATDLAASRFNQSRHAHSVAGLACGMVMPLGCCLGALVR